MLSIFYHSFLAITIKIVFLVLFGEWKLLFFWQKGFQDLIPMFFSPKSSRTGSLKTYLIRKWLTVNIWASAPWIAFLMLYRLVYNILSHENDLVFGLKYVVTVIQNGQSLTAKVSICNFLTSEMGSNCYSILRPADNKWVTLKLKRKVEYSWACTLEPLIPGFLFPLYRQAIVAFPLLYRIGFLFPLDDSEISMIILSDSNRNAWLLKVIHPTPFMFFKEQ